MEVWFGFFSPENGVHFVSSFLLDLLEEMAVGVHRHRNRRVPQQCLNRFVMDALCDQNGGGAVAQIMEADRAQLSRSAQILEDAIEAPLFERRSHARSEHVAPVAFP